MKEHGELEPRYPLEKKALPIIEPLLDDGTISSFETNCDLAKRVGYPFESDFLVNVPGFGSVDVECDYLPDHPRHRDLQRAIALYEAGIPVIHLSHAEIANPAEAGQKLRRCIDEIKKTGSLLPDETLDRRQRRINPGIPNLPTYALLVAQSRSAGGNAYGVRAEVRRMSRRKGEGKWGIGGKAAGGVVSQALVFGGETSRQDVMALLLAQPRLWEGVPASNLRIFSFSSKHHTQRSLVSAVFAAIAANPACSLASCNLEYAFAISQGKLDGDGAAYRIMSDLMVEAKSLAKTAARSEGGQRAQLVERTEEFRASADGGAPLEFDERARRLSWTCLRKTWSKQPGFEFMKDVSSKRVKGLLMREGLLSPHLEMPTAAGEALGIKRVRGMHGPYVAYGPAAAKHLLDLVIAEGLGAMAVSETAA